MFKITATPPVFRRTVTVFVPAGDTVDASQSVDVTYRALPLSEQNKHDGATIDGVKSLLDAVVVTVEGVVDDAGQPIPFDDALRAQLYDRPYVLGSLMNGFVQGMAAARLGN